MCPTTPNGAPGICERARALACGCPSQEGLPFAQRAARNEETVLLLGETGSGKTRLAKLIHEFSARSSKPFVRVNCGAIPEGLFEREMFGHVRGAFTDAKDSREGLFEAADRGTLFLDEIGELPLAVQSKLLVALDEGHIRRVGATRDTTVDVRIIAATNTDLAEQVRRGSFRQDLFHRLAVLRYRIPPLRERQGELPGLIYYLLGQRTSGGRAIRISEGALNGLCSYTWPGNIRELDNALRRALAFLEGETIEVHHLPEEILVPIVIVDPPAKSFQRSTCRYAAPESAQEERRLIIEALQAADGNKTQAAKRLGMSRSALWIKLQRYGFELPGRGGLTSDPMPPGHVDAGNDSAHPSAR
jgi:transcriptional regulator with PAS, ATPase and Fis domain